MDAIERALEILGMGPEATPEDVKQAYRDLAKVWHPDRFPNESRVRRKAEQKLKEINEAYRILKGYDPATRMRAGPGGAPSGRSTPAQDHDGGQAHNHDAPSPPFEPSVMEAPTPQAPGSGIRVPRWAYVFAAIVAIPLVSYLVNESTTLQRPRPRSVTYPPSMQVARQPSSPSSVCPQVGARDNSPIKLRPGGARGGDSSSRKSVADRNVSLSTTDGGVQRSAPSDVIPLPGAVSPEQTSRLAPDSFAVGSNKDEVLAVQGTPTESSDRVWKYGPSSVFFSNDGVTSWNVWPGSPLKVRMLPSQPVEATKGYFTVGSSKDEVLAAEGTPTEFSDRVWKYGPSSVFFSNGRVTSWNVWPGSPLKVRLESAKDQ